MKKSVLSFFLALLLSFQFLFPVAQATGETTDTAETTTPPTQETQPSPQVGTGSNYGIDATGALLTQAQADFDAGAVLLYEMNSGTMVYAKNIDEVRYPASLTKIMTCLLALEHGTLTDLVTVSETALADQDPSGSSAGLIVGEIYTLEQLLYCLMLASGNDAAPVIAEYVADTETAFIAMMNDKAKALGCENTHFANTHGMPNDNHYTTARDVAKIMMAALEYDVFREVYSTSRYELPPSNMREESSILVTTNFLIGTSVTAEYYDSRVIGGKTGFTTPAGRCIACTAKQGDLYYLCIVMGAKTEVTEDGATIYGSFVNASKVLDRGFGDYSFAKLLSPLSPVAQFPVEYATESVVLVPAETISTLLPKGYNESLLQTKCILDSPDGLTAPLEAGQVVGKVEIYYDTLCIASTDLCTMTAVQKQTFATAAVQAVEEIAESPWRVVVIVLSVLLAFLVLMFFLSAWVRSRRRRRRQRRRVRR